MHLYGDDDPQAIQPHCTLWWKMLFFQMKLSLEGKKYFVKKSVCAFSFFKKDAQFLSF